MNLYCFHFGFQNKRLTGEARVVGVDGSYEERARAAMERAESSPRDRTAARREIHEANTTDRGGLQEGIAESVEEKKEAAQSEINETRQAFSAAHLTAGMGLGTVQPAVENLQTRFQTLTANPSPRDFDALAQDAISARNQIQQWVQHRTLMTQIRERHLETDPRVVEIRRKLTVEGAEGQGARNTIATQNEALQNILAEGRERATGALAEQASAPATAPGEQATAPGEQPQAPAAPGTPETPEDQNENPVSWISAAFAAVGGFIGGAMGEKISKAGTWLQEGLTKLLGKMPVSIRYAFGLSNERLRGLGVAVNSADDLDPSGTGLSPWRVMVMPEAQLRIFVRAARRLDMVGEETRGKILEMKFSEFARKLPTQLSNDPTEQTQLAQLKTFLDNAGAPANETIAVVLGRIITDDQWRGYRPETAGTPNTPRVQGNQPGETPTTPPTPPERVNHFFASMRSEIHDFSMDDQNTLRLMKAQEIATGRATRPASLPERAWNTIANALREQEISDPDMNVAQFLQQKFQNPNYNPAIATA